ncbi:response regulator transcription factor [Paenibacillus puerhi]|uniref:response regulator transcription factor n=1 Tax=Paenibacillus puerhi TaxID=2692622 RepID=UPI001356CF69|nr:response regulator transcription factor [Paenibacillus puerhi]
MKKILLIEDERNLARFVELELRNEAYLVTVAYEGTNGLELALQEEWGVILLDLMLPGISGLDICRQVRAIKRTPIIMLTARDSIADRVSGLDSGADDYIPKPFAIEELLARIRVVFRRQEDEAGEAKEGKSLLVFQNLSVDTDSRMVRRGTELIELTKREYALFVTFMSNVNRVLTRETLLDQVWGFDAPVDTNVVDVYVRYLRNKIDTPGEASYIQTQRGIGYVMRR